jgi:CDGSH-type Zn-finger protein
VSEEPRILVIEHGPYVVTGSVPLLRLFKDEEGAWVEGPPLPTDPTYALCRCGRTSEAPFCDEVDSCTKAPTALVRVARPVGWDVPFSSPAVALKPNGPLRVRGVGLSADDGTVFEPVGRCSLCRCGRSHTMPFCDGSHKEVGFRG